MDEKNSTVPNDVPSGRNAVFSSISTSTAGVHEQSQDPESSTSRRRGRGRPRTIFGPTNRQGINEVITNIGENNNTVATDVPNRRRRFADISTSTAVSNSQSQDPESSTSRRRGRGRPRTIFGPTNRQGINEVITNIGENNNTVATDVPNRRRRFADISTSTAVSNSQSQDPESSTSRRRGRGRPRTIFGPTNRQGINEVITNIGENNNTVATDVPNRRRRFADISTSTAVSNSQSQDPESSTSERRGRGRPRTRFGPVNPPGINEANPNIGENNSTVANDAPSERRRFVDISTSTAVSNSQLQDPESSTTRKRARGRPRTIFGPVNRLGLIEANTNIGENNSTVADDVPSTRRRFEDISTSALVSNSQLQDPESSTTRKRARGRPRTIFGPVNRPRTDEANTNIDPESSTTRRRGRPRTNVAPIIRRGINATNTNIDYWDIGDADQQCQFCRAAFWYAERIRSEHRVANPVYTSCCNRGNITLPRMKTPPSLLLDLTSGNGPRSKHFIQNMRSYNSMFAFTSMGGKIDRSINRGNAPPVFKMHGQNYHYIGGLLPTEGQQPKFAQLYIYDTSNEVSNRINSVRSSENAKTLQEDVVDELKTMLDENNILVKSFRMAREKMAEVGEENVSLKLIGRRSSQPTTYNLPDVSEVAALIVGDFDEQLGNRDIVIQTRSGILQRINELHPSYMGLQYPLLFPYGEDGYRDDYCYSRDRAEGGRKRIKVTVRDFFAYRFHDRSNDDSLLLKCRRLTQQLIVDAYTIVESGRSNEMSFYVRFLHFL
ncbi:hypothetical protein CASFOL_034951 [Castilleja foliolosa]|uniref:Helitron helicase-like domain-containing protein n=1 Tax=Castilleja foliolosa TaxID=1961234 RepID=A0ABD3BRZ7_9LAMI